MAGASPVQAVAALEERNQVNKILNAAQNGDLTLLKESVQSFAAGQDPRKLIADMKDANGRNALHFAARNGRDGICKYLVEEMLVPVDIRDNDGETPLIHAARQGHFSTAQFLLDHGADPLATSEELGATALHHAAATGSIELLKLLLEKGVNVDAPSDAGTPLIWAAGHAQLEAVKCLVEHGADINTITDDDVTPLLTAAATGSDEILDLLVKKGADVNAIGSSVTPLHIAADMGNGKIVLCLLDAGADPNAVDSDGVKPIQAAAAKGYREVVEMLLSVTKRDPAVPEWSVDGLIAYAKQLSSQEQEASKSKNEVSDDKKQKNIATMQVTEAPSEKREKALEAKARGDDAFKQKNYMLAMDAYTQALDLDPYNALVLSNRSLCWIRLGQAEHALTDARAARALRPDWPKACYREGSALRLLQHFEEAANCFYEGLQLDPENKELVDAFRETVEAGRKLNQAQTSSDTK